MTTRQSFLGGSQVFKRIYRLEQEAEKTVSRSERGKRHYVTNVEIDGKERVGFPS